MTYELGQQVLVRGVVDVVTPRKVWVKFSESEPNPNGIRYPQLVLVPAADVVGPAPATPDAGGETIRAISDDMYTFRAQRDEARDALAAAEAERDALRDRLTAALTAANQIQASLDGAIRLNRALSVEAAGTKGGGGHE
jgi:hypothetical protein